MEMVSGLFLSKDIVYQNGKPDSLVDLSTAFEWLFNIKIGDCYQKHEDVIKMCIRDRNIQWVFSEITATSFRWQGRVKCPDDTGETEAELFAVRR